MKREKEKISGLTELRVRTTSVDYSFPRNEKRIRCDRR